jgi:anti-sigma-K factor RskA
LGIADQARQVLLQVPSHMLNQPIDLGSHLDIALNAQGGSLVAPP